MSIKSDFYVVGIGASAGGLDAVQQYFNNIDNDCGVAFIVIQHLSPDFKSLMPELLAKYTKMQIYTAENNQEIKPNCIYLNQRNKNLIIKGNRLFLVDKAPKEHLNLPIDIFFHSLGEEIKDRAIGIILSGTGSDGSRGIKTIKENGGIVLVQDPDTAQFDGMPKSAIYTNLVDFILSPQELAKKTQQFTQHKLNILPDITEQSQIEKIYKLILTEIFNYTGVDFKKYKHNTLVRRLEKRMTLHNFTNIEDYYNFLKTNEIEKNALKQEFLIGVTSFFRDKDAFKILLNKVIPSIIQSKENNDTIRIWVPGCSTGEEAYSIAILFDKFIRDSKSNIDFKIFATDIDKKALEKASNGSYPVNNFAEIDKIYFEDYFYKTGEQIQIIKRIREKIVFSLHDITVDPPFIRLDLISCRNLLIYLTNETQKKVLETFQFALNKGGFLFLGSSETLGTTNKYFKTIDSKWKIFQNTKDNFKNLPNRTSDDNQHIKKYDTIYQNYSFLQNRKITTKQNEIIFYKYLAKVHAPTTVFIDNDFNILFIHGNFQQWYNVPEGIYNNNILNLVNPELANLIRNSIRQIKERKVSISIENFIVSNNDKNLKINIFFDIVNIPDANEDIFLIQIGNSIEIQAAERIVLKDNDLNEYSKRRIEELEQELKDTKIELQNVIEELEASNEELQSANEELMSSNEELQSANEELQSVNEELYTVNTEFQEKNKELTSLNNDITNLLNSIDVGTLFLDRELNIRKFTNEIKRVFKLEDSDIGRSISVFASNFLDDTRQMIIDEAKNALENLKSSENEIQDKDGNWYLKRVKPFITADKTIDGVIITFININNLKRTSIELSKAEKRLSLALNAGNIAWWEMSLPSGEVICSTNKATMLGYNPNEFKNYNDFMKLVHPDDYENTMNAMRYLINGVKDTYECQYRIKNSEGEYLWFHDSGKISHKDNEKIIVTGVIKDITTTKLLEINLKEALKKAEIANMYKNQFLANMSHEIRTPLNAIVGFTSLLKEDVDKDKKEKYITIIENSSRQLLNLINDIIDLSKIEAGELSLFYEDCNLRALFLEKEIIYNQLKKQKNKDHLIIKLILPQDNNDYIIKTDHVRLRQILNNLMDNAIKFTEQGTIEFGFKVENDKLKIFVKDTGIGIPNDKINLVFERFQRGDHIDVAKYEGTGLGLAIVKGIVNKLGGTIQVFSKVNVGSEFIIILPYIVSNKESTINLETSGNNILAQKLENKSVLIVEDDPTCAILLKEILKKFNLQIIWIDNGLDAIELYKKHKVDIIFMDIRLPKLDGIQSAKEILKINPNAKIIAQTAYAMPEDLVKYKDSGFCDFVTKPIKKNVFLTTLNKWL